MRIDLRFFGMGMIFGAIPFGVELTKLHVSLMFMGACVIIWGIVKESNNSSR